MPNPRHYVYRGKHRKSQVSRVKSSLIVTAAVAVASLGFTGTSYAAADSTWDKLAQCESSGNWKINTGNGYSGGLQFHPTTWKAFGGEGSAHNASREQQIAVAERVLAKQGWGAWPSCSRKIGARGEATPRPKTAAKKETVVQKEVAQAKPKVKAKNPTKVLPAPPSGNYTVKAGDTLGKIAAERGTTWRVIFKMNPRIDDPNMIYVGQQISV